MEVCQVTKRGRNARGDDIWQIHVKGQGTSPDSPAIFKVQVPLHKESKEKAVGSKLVQAVQQKVDLLIIVDGSHAEAPDIWCFLLPRPGWDVPGVCNPLTTGVRRRGASGWPSR